jgi:hypothetical protein
MMTGAWPTPQAQAYWQGMQSGQFPYPYYSGAWPITPPVFSGGVTPEQEIEMLKDQVDILQDQIDEITARINDLEED